MKISILNRLIRAFKGKNLIGTCPFRLLIFVIASACLCLPAQAGGTGKGRTIRTVVIDAGHGGKDPGAVGKQSKEKDIVLAVALKTGKLISNQFKDVKVVYTRSRDEFVELYKRAEIANRNQADLFISIHCNASKSRIHYGAETFVMGLHRSEANLAVAKLENASVLFEDDYTATYEGFDPNSPESHIIFSFYQNIYREQSLGFASMVQEQLVGHSGRFDRGVKEAGFLVLYRTSMPSVLVELGFISNENEERYLKSEHGQNQLSNALFRAFSRYKAEVEGLSEVPPAAGAKPATVETVVDSGKASAVAKPEPKPEQRTKEPTPEPLAATPAKPSGTAIVFRVQVLTSSVELRKNDPRLSGLEEIFSYKHQGAYKYTAGKFSAEADALRYRDRLRQQGFKDAFVVPFRGDVRITPGEARSAGP